MKQPNITYAQLLTLYEVSRKINSQLNFQKLLDEIMDQAIGLLKAEKGVLLLRDANSDELTVQVARLMDKRNIDDVVALSHTVIRKVEEEGKPFLIQKVPDLQGSSANTSLFRHKIKSVVCVPLRTKHQFIGTIYLDTTKPDHFFKQEDVAFLEGFANLAGVAIENARTYSQIENLNANLENLVDQRTQELKVKNTELEKAYSELKETQSQLLRSEKMASLGMLVAGIAHEINTPLASINSNTDMFMRGFVKLKTKIENLKGSTQDAQKTVDILDNLANVNATACERITGIVKTLRTFARLDEEDFKTVDLHEGIDSTLSLTAHLSRDRIQVVKEYGDIPKLTCYGNQLNQVFMNILVNACQAIKDKGIITIRTSFENEHIKLEFSDTGVGIPKENLEKIFYPGFTTKGVGVGTGLGLSISYRIIEEHGGKILVQSEVGTGTTFTIILPLRNPNKPSASAKEA